MLKDPLPAKPKIDVLIASERHHSYAQTIVDEMAASAAVRGTGIAKRTPEFIQKKMSEGKAVIALTRSGEWVGFCYIESWSHGRFVANSGLIVNPSFRQFGIGRKIKSRIFELSRSRYPKAKIFGLTTGRSVMRINSALGYEPVTYSELTTDPEFWKGCQSCPNYAILTSKGHKNCLCTAMVYDPKESTVKKFKGRKLHHTLRSDLSDFWRLIRLRFRGLLLDAKLMTKKTGRPPHHTLPTI